MYTWQDEDVIIESEEEIVHDDDDEHVKELKVKKHKLKQMKQEQEKHKEDVQVNNIYQYFMHFTFGLAEGYYQ